MSPSIITTDETLPTGADQGYLISYDLLGPVEPESDIAGNIHAFVCVEAEGGRGHIRLSKTKAGLQTALAEVIQLMQHMHGKPADNAKPIQFKPVHRAHSDDDAAFKADPQGSKCVAHCHWWLQLKQKLQG